MSFRLLFKPRAEAEIAEAFSWYEAQTSSLGHEFLEELERVERLVCFNPRLYPQVEAEVRGAGLRRFPSTLFDVMEEQEVHVLACFHQSRAPQSMRTF